MAEYEHGSLVQFSLPVTVTLTKSIYAVLLTSFVWSSLFQWSLILISTVSQFAVLFRVLELFVICYTLTVTKIFEGISHLLQTYPMPLTSSKFLFSNAFSSTDVSSVFTVCLTPFSTVCLRWSNWLKTYISPWFLSEHFDRWCVSIPQEIIVKCLSLFRDDSLFCCPGPN